jgi:hypothetical protein
MAAYFLPHCYPHLYVMPVVARDLQQEETQMQQSIGYTLHVVHELQVCEVYNCLTWGFEVLKEIIDKYIFTLDIRKQPTLIRRSIQNYLSKCSWCIWNS